MRMALKVGANALLVEDAVLFRRVGRDGLAHVERISGPDGRRQRSSWRRGGLRFDGRACAVIAWPRPAFGNRVLGFRSENSRRAALAASRRELRRDSVWCFHWHSGFTKILLEKVAKELADGYQRIKIKIKRGWDLEIVRKVRDRFPEIHLMGDANSAYSLGDVDLFRALDEFDLMMIEQPLAHDDIVDHAQLQKEIKTAV